MKQTLLFLMLLLLVDVKAQINFTEIYHEFDNFDFINEVVHGDLNNDGYDDFILTSYSAEKLFIGINDSLKRPDLVPFENNLDIRFLSLYDIDNDDDLDLIGSDVFDDKSYCWKNDGSGNFTREQLPFLDYSSIHFSDLDGDDIGEMILGIDGKMSVYSLLNDTVTFIKIVVDDPFIGEPGGIVTLDYNRDSVEDIAATFGGDGIKVFIQSNDLEFTILDLTPSSFNNDKLVSSNINSDTIADFVLYSEFSTRTTIFRSTSYAMYESEILPEPNGRNRFTAFGDINRDGLLDIFYTEEESSVLGTSSIYVGGLDTFSQQIIDENYSSIAGGGFADLDQDGDQDIFMQTIFSMKA